MVDSVVNAPFPEIDFAVKSGGADKQRSSCVMVGVYAGRKLTEAARAIDEQTERGITTVTRRGDFDGKLGSTLVLYKLPNAFADRVMLVGLGKEKSFDDGAYAKATQAAAKALGSTGTKDAVSFLSSLPVRGRGEMWRSEMWKIRQAAMHTAAALYRYDATKSQKTDPLDLNKMVFDMPSRRDLADGEIALQEGLSIARGVKLAKDLANLPGNICTPSYLANKAKKLAQEYKKFKTEILDEDDIQALGMGSFMSVANGSQEPAKLIVMHYSGGGRKAQPQVLVGKGLTFDAGGISIKPAAGMDEMKYDMCGGASVIGVMLAVAELQLPINVVGIVPSTENLLDGFANKPGDIVTSMSGQTIEVLNTDAEGRLILCDALTYAERFDPAAVIDVATLTGACVIALGKHASGRYANNKALAKAVDAAGDEASDRCWPMPLWDDYQSQLDSNFADIANVGGREAGSVTAACFLSRFTAAYPWVHLDIAGTAWLSGAQKGATGRPVPLLVQYLLNVAAQQDS